MIYAINLNTKEHCIVYDNDAHGATKLGDLPHIVGYRFVEADAGGWIEWSGNTKCPLPDRSKYECVIGDSNTYTDGTFPIMLKWQHVKKYKPILDLQAEQVKEWRGPEDGLPPVGTVCEVDVDEKWQECTVIAHFRQPARMVAAFTMDVNRGSTRLDYCIEEHFRPLRTEREQWFEAAMKAVSEADFTTDTYEAIYDAGLARLPGE